MANEWPSPELVNADDIAHWGSSDMCATHVLHDITRDILESIDDAERNGGQQPPPVAVIKPPEMPTLPPVAADRNGMGRHPAIQEERSLVSTVPSRL